MCRVPLSSHWQPPKISKKNQHIEAAGLPLSRLQDRVSRLFLERSPWSALRSAMVKLKDHSPGPALRRALLSLKKTLPAPALPRAFPGLRQLSLWPALRRPLFKLLESPLFRPGIVVRLAIAFVAVALLAVAANLIVEHGESIIQTTTIRSSAPPIVVVEPPVVATPPAAETAPVPAPAAPVDIIAAAHADFLLAAIVQFERAAERRGEVSNAANDELLHTATKRLHEEMSDFVFKSDGPTIRAPLKKLTARAAFLYHDGEEVVRDSDARRAMVSEYWERFENVDR